MKKIFIILTIAVIGLLMTGCEDPAPKAELDYKGGTEEIITEKIIYEEVTWENVETQTWD